MAENINNTDVFEKLLNVQRIMRMLRHQKMAERGPAADPTRGRGRIIALLKLCDGIPTRDIAQILGIRVSSLNEVLAKMERDGLVERVQSEEDKRVMLVNLTDKGREEEQETHLPDKLFAGFDEQELAAFDAGLDKIIGNLEGELGEDAQTLLEEGLLKRLHRRYGPGPGRGPHECPCEPRGEGDLHAHQEIFGDHGPHLCDGPGGFGPGPGGDFRPGPCDFGPGGPGGFGPQDGFDQHGEPFTRAHHGRKCRRYPGGRYYC